jgi:hypothetical protein
MRMTEILSIRRENVRLDQKRIFIPAAKAGSRDQPITTEWRYSLPIISPGYQGGRVVIS